MLACIFAAAKREGAPALPYARMMLRAGLAGCVERLHTVSPELATIFLDVSLENANLDRPLFAVGLGHSHRPDAPTAH